MDDKIFVGRMALNNRKLFFEYDANFIDTGLNLPKAKLFPARKDLGFFGSKRFDKTDDAIVHIHTISALLHADHSPPTLDYEMIMKATMHLTKDMKGCERIRKTI